MLYLIGLGMGDARDVTVRGREAIDKCDTVFLEAYTSILGVDQAELVRELFSRLLFLPCSLFLVRCSLLVSSSLLVVVMVVLFPVLLSYH